MVPTACVKWFEDASLPEGGLFCFRKHGREQLASPPSKLMDGVYELASLVSSGSSPEVLFLITSHKRHLLPALDIDPSLVSSTIEGWEEFWDKLPQDASTSPPLLRRSLCLYGFAYKIPVRHKPLWSGFSTPHFCLWTPSICPSHLCPVPRCCRIPSFSRWRCPSSTHSQPPGSWCALIYWRGIWREAVVELFCHLSYVSGEWLTD